MSNKRFPSLACLITLNGDLRVLTSIALFAFLALGCKEHAPKGLARGAELFQSCASCHGENGLGNRELKAPNIAGLHEKYIIKQLSNFKSGYRGLHHLDTEGQRMNPMARHIRTEQDMESLAIHIAQLKSVKPEPTPNFGGDSIKGKAHFASCGACHGADGGGNTDMNSPSLLIGNDWYLFAQLKKFDHKIRGYSPSDTGGSIMINSVKVLNGDEQMMRDVVAYIMTLKK